MKNLSISLLTLSTIVLMSCNSTPKKEKNSIKEEATDSRTVQIKLGITGNKMSKEWKEALRNRKSSKVLDSLSKVEKELTNEEQEWITLIESKASKWNTIRDSIKVPFENIKLNDTVTVLLGYQGGDDAFTPNVKTICLDVNTLQREYGSAKKPVNDNRIDRIFAHEFTHLLHKEWATKNNLSINTFKDQILWECTLEGFGMYRSMSSKWFPKGDSLSATSKKTFDNLYPIFAEKIIKVLGQPNLTEEEENEIHANLSRGPMKRKWGALPVAVWLAAEAKGNDKNLIKWVNKGPDAIVLLAEKYLTGESKVAFDEFLKNNKDSH
ncbi:MULTISPECIES: hypothetical protein [unclassified Tenacibaculum]|uniref:hypothetical protein n=1 Tax=unclassified Tenacibaculum TaxID=2635139 RepID=UPI001F45469F|nr:MULTISPECIES: hypothetical protein [unclassified Tenacibaculum]MCF2876479.1 hypothetical protein [Tenacibaculum sp. Cn5-1]MCF2936614.1 hypothetical protein [Tenacibaculum sp. Cn5-34]MCG7511793.1 hypothetical protein [Tenacibaculum sp. Cn5-46]